MKKENQRQIINRGSAILLLAGVVSLFATVGIARGEDAKPPEPPKWQNVAALGLTLTSGNSENLLATASINSTKKWKTEEVLLGASGGYGQNTTTSSAGVKTTTETDNYANGFAQWNHLFTERLYGGLRFNAAYDEIADLQYRFTLSPLVGYYLIKHTNSFLVAEFGPSAIAEKLGGDENTYIGLRFAERGERTFKSGVKIWEGVAFIPQVDDFNNYIINAEAGVAAPLSKIMDLRFIVQDNFINEPAPGRKQNDLKLILAVGFKF